MPDGAEELRMGKAFIRQSFLEELAVGDNVKELVFEGNDNLKILSFGMAMETIEFRELPPIIEVNAKSPVAPDFKLYFGVQISDFQKKICKIHVPVGCSSSYIEKGWDALGQIIPDVELAGIQEIEDISGVRMPERIMPYELCNVYNAAGIELAKSIPFGDVGSLDLGGIVIIRSLSTGKTEKQRMK